MAILSEYRESGGGAYAPLRDQFLERHGEAATVTPKPRPQNRGPDGPSAHDDAHTGLADIAQLLLNARRKRSEGFPDMEFDDAAWTMTLDLYAKHAAGRHATIMSLCTVSGAPQTSALRSINAMVGLGHFIRRKDPADARRVFIHPSDGLVEAVGRYLSDFGCRIATLVRPAPASGHTGFANAKRS
jgi:hypothetical protein